MSQFHVYDTTLRDGAQQEGLSLSVQDKLLIATQLDELFQSDTLAAMSTAAAARGRRDAAAAIAREVCDVAGLS